MIYSPQTVISVKKYLWRWGIKRNNRYNGLLGGLDCELRGSIELSELMKKGL